MIDGGFQIFIRKVVGGSVRRVLFPMISCLYSWPDYMRIDLGCIVLVFEYPPGHIMNFVKLLILEIYCHWLTRA